MVYSLLSMLGTHDKDDMSRTLFAMSQSQDSCIAMRQSGGCGVVSVCVCCHARCLPCPSQGSNLSKNVLYFVPKSRLLVFINIILKPVSDMM